MKYFIVDDSKIIRARLIIELSCMPGVEIIGQAENVSEAVSKVLQKLPDVVILDVKLPDGNGIDVLKVIKKEIPKTKVIMFTNYPYPQFREEAIKAGADYFFDKSTEWDKMVEIISNKN